MKNLQGKRILVCGGATGIGAATVRRLCEEGARVGIGDLNHDGFLDIYAGYANVFNSPSSIDDKLETYLPKRVQISG